MPSRSSGIPSRAAWQSSGWVNGPSSGPDHWMQIVNEIEENRINLSRCDRISSCEQCRRKRSRTRRASTHHVFDIRGVGNKSQDAHNGIYWPSWFILWPTFLNFIFDFGTNIFRFFQFDKEAVCFVLSQNKRNFYVQSIRAALKLKWYRLLRFIMFSLTLTKCWMVFHMEASNLVSLSSYSTAYPVPLLHALDISRPGNRRVFPSLTARGFAPGLSEKKIPSWRPVFHPESNDNPSVHCLGHRLDLQMLRCEKRVKQTEQFSDVVHILFHANNSVTRDLECKGHLHKLSCETTSGGREHNVYGTQIECNKKNKTSDDYLRKFCGQLQK